MGKKKHGILTALLLCGCAAAGACTLREQLRMILRQTVWEKPQDVRPTAPASPPVRAAEPAPAEEKPAESDPAPIVASEPVSAAAERSTPAELVWWTKNGRSYHRSRDCRTLSRSSAATLCSGSVAEAAAAGKSDPCDLCAL